MKFKDVSEALEKIKDQEKTIERLKAFVKESMVARLAFKQLLIKHGKLPDVCHAPEINDSELTGNEPLIESTKGGVDRPVISDDSDSINSEKEKGDIERYSHDSAGGVIKINEIDFHLSEIIEQIENNEKIIERLKEVLKEWILYSPEIKPTRFTNYGSMRRKFLEIESLCEEAKKENCPDKLGLLSTHSEVSVRRVVAEHENSSADILNKLGSDCVDEIRIAVANNRNTPQGVLELLSRDSLRGVRKAVAMHPNTSQPILTILGRDEDPVVRLCVASNLNSSDEIICELTSDNDFEIRMRIASLIKLSKEAVLNLSKDVSPAIRRRIAERNNTPKFILHELAKDVVLYVRKAAEAHPKLRNII
jgi:hypothetical protein